MFDVLEHRYPRSNSIVNIMVQSSQSEMRNASPSTMVGASYDMMYVWLFVDVVGATSSEGFLIHLFILYCPH